MTLQPMPGVYPAAHGRGAPHYAGFVSMLAAVVVS
jgi:hypothetical protein